MEVGINHVDHWPDNCIAPDPYRFRTANVQTIVEKHIVADPQLGVLLDRNR
ncbi:hypothetical protein D3C77_811280 [compost metagenome]